MSSSVKTIGFLLLLQLFTAGCGALAETKFNDGNAAGQSNKSLVQPTPETLSPPKAVTPNLLFGSIDINDAGDSVKLSVWTQDARLYSDETNGKIIVAKQMNVDVMNCGGYLGSATALYENQIWELKLIPETISKDFTGKVKQCGQAFSGGRISTSAVAVFPTDEKRKNIKITKAADVREIFKQFPEDVRQLTGLNDKSLSKNKQLTDNLSNSSTDLDGDGVVDFILLGGDCLPGGEAGCELVMQLINGKWKQTARIEPF